MREITLTVDEAKKIITNNANEEMDFIYHLDLSENKLLIYDNTENGIRVRDRDLFAKFKTREMIELIDHKGDLKLKKLNEADLVQETKLKEFVGKV